MDHSLTLQQALQLHQSGRLADAETCYRRILHQDPHHAETLFLLGTLASQVDQLPDAVALIQRAIAAKPGNAMFHANLGECHRRMKRLDLAIPALQKSIELWPNNALSYSNLALALQEAGQLDQAIAACEKAIQLQPDLAEAHNNLGNVLDEKGDLPRALDAYRRSIILRPDIPATHRNLARALDRAGLTDQSIEAFQQAIRLKPDYAEAYKELAAVLLAKGRLDEAVAACTHAIRIQPDYAGAYNNLGMVFKDQGRLDQAMDCFRKASALDPSASYAQSNLLYTMYFHPDFDAKRILEEHQRWAKSCQAPLIALRRPHDNDLSPDRRLKIGYVSPNFCHHVVGWNLVPLFQQHDHAQFEIFCYSDVRSPDDMTETFRHGADQWRPIRGQADDHVANLIRADKIDILIDLTLHMSDNRMALFARKPAPIQANYLGCCDGTGLETMDYRFSDRYLDPPGTDRFYVEKTFRLPVSYWCYSPGGTAPDIAPLPERTTFICLNNFAKVSTPALDLWKKILDAVPDSRLILHSRPGSHRQRVIDHVGTAVHFVGMQNWPDYMRTFSQASISLDPFPYCGGITTCDSFWMGLPVVSLAGHTAIARAGRSLLSHVGLSELVADTPDEYVKIAVALANDRARLTEIRRTLRDRMKACPLMDAPRLARDIEQAYRQMWHTWLNR